MAFGLYGETYVCSEIYLTALVWTAGVAGCMLGRRERDEKDEGERRKSREGG